MYTLVSAPEILDGFDRSPIYTCPYLAAFVTMPIRMHVLIDRLSQSKVQASIVTGSQSQCLEVTMLGAALNGHADTFTTVYAVPDYAFCSLIRFAM